MPVLGLDRVGSWSSRIGNRTILRRVERTERVERVEDELRSCRRVVGRLFRLG